MLLLTFDDIPEGPPFGMPSGGRLNEAAAMGGYSPCANYRVTLRH
jgi:hypothetical protein